MLNAYAADLAQIHDVGFGALARAAAAEVQQQLSARGWRDGLVVDLGCGSGIMAELLVQAGYSIYGVDIAEAMIALARQRVPQARFEVGSLLDVPLPACRAVTAIGECCNYLFDPSHSGERLHTLFERVYAALEPGGIFVFDSATPERLGGASSQRSWVEGQGWAVLMQADIDAAQNLLTRRIITFRQTGMHYRRTEETHRLRLLDQHAISAELAGVGFTVASITAYADLPLFPGLAGFVATKPA